MKPHNRKIARKPARKACPGLRLMNIQTANAAIAIVHHGKNKPSPKPVKAINITDARNFMFKI